MQEFLEKKEEKQKPEVPKTPKLSLKNAIVSTEGLMKISQESQKIEKMGRESFEKSVKIELEQIKKKAQKKRKKAPKKKKKAAPSDTKRNQE